MKKVLILFALLLIFIRVGYYFPNAAAQEVETAAQNCPYCGKGDISSYHYTEMVLPEGIFTTCDTALNRFWAKTVTGDFKPLAVTEAEEAAEKVREEAQREQRLRETPPAQNTDIATSTGIVLSEGSYSHSSSLMSLYSYSTETRLCDFCGQEYKATVGSSIYSSADGHLVTYPFGKDSYFQSCTAEIGRMMALVARGRVLSEQDLTGKKKEN